MGLLGPFERGFFDSDANDFRVKCDVPDNRVIEDLLRSALTVRHRLFDFPDFRSLADFVAKRNFLLRSKQLKDSGEFPVD